MATTILGGLFLEAGPAGAADIIQPNGDIDLTSASGNVLIGPNTTVDAENGNVNVTAADAVQVTGNSALEASGNVTLQSGGSGTAITNSTITAGGNVTISAPGPFWTLGPANVTSNGGNVTIVDTGGLSMGANVVAAGDELNGFEAVEVTVTGGCPGQLATMTAIEVMPVGASVSDEFWPFGSGCEQVDFGWGPPNHNPSEDVTVGGGTVFANEVLSGTQQGGVTHPATGVANVTLTYSPSLPLAVISAPVTGGPYALGQSVPTSFACAGVCVDSNGQAAPEGALDTSTAGAHTYSVTATKGGFTDVASIGYSVDTATPQVTWNTPGPITYGMPLSAVQLDATSNVPGTFVYNPPAGTVLNAGDQPLTATFTPTDQTDFTTATATVTLHVAPVPLLITASSNAVPYQFPIPAITPSYSGFVNHDGPGSLDPGPTCGTLATAGTPVGTYGTSCSGAVDPNYTITYVPGTIVITKAATTLVAAPISVVGSVVSLHVTFSATLTSNVTGQGLGLQPVTFTWAGGQCTTYTNASGVATCDAIILSIVPLLLSPRYGVAYAGAANYQATAATAGLKLL